MDIEKLPLLPILFMIIISAEVVRELCFKWGALHSAKAARDQGNIAYTFKVLCIPYIWLGFFLWSIEIVTWVQALRHCPLTIAFPILSLCYVLLPIASNIFFHEPIPAKKWLAIACITIGVGLIGMSGIG